ncbi:glycosyltransferase family 2 protein [Microbacterium esteraromaticum]|uniref:glycosyltransferase family 2 protein n=1 Tax=Microbacterium esteraromaticum TaxID=57043 RepID=UPI001A905893|nr:glycosyltransferase family 2 protein [Microbacterium esteraromaticum]MBN8423812.1 glycosyltransferase family 2 protein [Microbacterium esteraromaticum]
MSPVDLSALVVIPALNEEGSVADVVRDVRTVYPRATCLVVDDGSTDRTADRARTAGAQVLQLPFNLGVGGAMRAGFRFARAHGYDVVVQVDADGQHDAAMIAELIDGLADADLVIGARFAGRGDYGVRGPRKWAMRALSSVMSRVARTRLTDVTSGFKAAGPRAVALFADEFPAEYLGDTIEALVIASRAGLTVRQIPVEMRARQAGVPSHRPFKAAVYLLRACAAFLLAMMRPRAVLGGDS